MPPINSMKTWKIILLVIGVLAVLFIGFVVYNDYQYSKFYDEAENLAVVRFGTEIFNSKLKNCELSYANTWEIRGLENSKCIVSFKWNSDVNYDIGSVTSNWIVCELPYEVYGEDIVWNEIIDGEICNSK